MKRKIFDYAMAAGIFLGFAFGPLAVAGYTPNAMQSLSQVVPEMDSGNCKNIAMSSLTPTLIASGTGLHLDRSYDMSANGATCWCDTAGNAGATATGRHFPNGAIVVGRMPSARQLHCSCDGAATFTACANARN